MKQFLVTSAWFDGFNPFPSYEFNRLMDEDSLINTGCKLPRSVGQSISRIARAGKDKIYRLTVDTITRVQ